MNKLRTIRLQLRDNITAFIEYYSGALHVIFSCSDTVIELGKHESSFSSSEEFLMVLSGIIEEIAQNGKLEEIFGEVKTHLVMDDVNVPSVVVDFIFKASRLVITDFKYLLDKVQWTAYDMEEYAAKKSENSEYSLFDYLRFKEETEGVDL